VAGNYDLARGFVTGFLSGRTFPTPAIFSRECGIRRVSLGERMLSWSGVHEHLVHVIVEQGIAGDLIREITTGETGLDLEVVSNRRIEKATFHFHYKVFGKVYGEEIRKIFESAPSGVKVEYTEGPDERVDPGAKGLEVYAPTHDYELSAKGSATGRFDEILALFQKLVEHPLVEVDEVHLEYEDMKQD
jgi:hypothetical protein